MLPRSARVAQLTDGHTDWAPLCDPSVQCFTATLVLHLPSCHPTAPKGHKTILIPENNNKKRKSINKINLFCTHTQNWSLKVSCAMFTRKYGRVRIFSFLCVDLWTFFFGRQTPSNLSLRSAVSFPWVISSALCAQSE